MGRGTLFGLNVAAVVTAFFACASVAAAETTAAKGIENVHPGQPGSRLDGIAHVTLGQSAVPLYGPWKFSVGDSPIDSKTGKPLWAEPDFDDSKWETVDLTPKNGAIDPNGGLSGYVPGWTAKGHPGYWGYAWYRIRVLAPQQNDGLALAGPAIVDDVYQVFDNGELAGQFGGFTGSKPAVYYSQPKMFLLVQPSSHEAMTGQSGNGPGETSPADPTQVLAFRVWMEPLSLVNQPDAGGLHSAPVLGGEGAVKAGYQLRWLELTRAYASRATQAVLFGLLAVIVFPLILFDRSDRVYLWMGALFLLIAVFNALLVIGAWTELLSIPVNNLLTDCLLNPLISAAWVMVFWIWFRLQRPSWLPRITAVLTLLLSVSFVLSDEVIFPPRRCTRNFGSTWARYSGASPSRSRAGLKKLTA